MLTVLNVSRLFEHVGGLVFAWRSLNEHDFIDDWYDGAGYTRQLSQRRAVVICDSF
jgi:hypothetical protein